MSNTTLIALISLAVPLLLVSAWSFRNLPGESWQFIAAVPLSREGKGWKGINFTWYGAITATAYLTALIIAHILLLSMGFSLKIILFIAVTILGISIPAAKIIPRFVEKKKSTISIGGAFFAGITAAPWAIVLAYRLFSVSPGNLWEIPVLPIMAIVSIAYTFGEGIGRLACISFGCCYGKPVEELKGPLAHIFKGIHFIFRGPTKKISYASNLDGVAVVPVQAMTVILYSVTGLISLALFLEGHFQSAFIIPITVTQLWRYLSELLRADYRGTGSISAYQVMSIIAVAYAILISYIFPAAEGILPVLEKGVKGIWSAGTLIIYQVLWLMMFFYTGKSEVTGSTISFTINKNRI
jgi:hypothetical protein